MYVEVTIDVKRYGAEEFDLRLSDLHSLKKLIDIAWQVRSISEKQREGHWIRVVNKNKAYPGYLTLAECGITTGDRVELM